MRLLHFIVVGLTALALTFFFARLCDGQLPAGGAAPPLSAEQREAVGVLLDRGALVQRDAESPGQPIVMIDFAHNAELRDAWLADLAKFPQLRVLGLAGTALSDAGLDHLTGLAELESLAINDTPVSDAGLPKLAACTKLRRLDVRGTKVSAAAVAELQMKLPALKLVSDVPAATLEQTTKVEQTDAAPPKVSLNGADKPVTRGVRPETAVEGKRYTAADVEALREKVRALTQDGLEDLPEGWTKGRRDVAQVTALFPTLKLRAGFRLVAYVFREGGNGSGFVWALPLDAEFPEPADCPKLETHFLNPPKPFDALEPSEIFDGDGSPDSYLHASLLRRELHDYAASWHGLVWSAHTILDAFPKVRDENDANSDPLKQTGTPKNLWKWKEPEPLDYNPTVRFDGDRVTVTFFTFCPLERERIFRHVDVYRRSKYRPVKVEDDIEIGEGRGGVAF